ncbi:MAG TPA: NAD-dependent epimerase/dehydratase family protein [Niabella sp.]|nr:NAD-dependent epimerase/dehydratase family protein [Chitinophagaceae bacterium]HRO83962.1 NAD-dependent epimerase/dehydratase family protein [Niabella sp.]
MVEEGHAVRAIKRPTGKLPYFVDSKVLEKVEWVEGDVLDVNALADAMQGIDTIIHAAAVVSFGKADREKMYQINIEGTANVVNVALENGVRRLVYISSVAALGRKKNSTIVDEATKWEDSKSNTHYSITKYRAELEVWRGFAEGLEGVILNPATILGYGNWNDGSCALFKNSWKEFSWFTHGINGFADVEDVAKAAVALMKTDITEQRYLVCNDNWSFKKLFDTIAEGFGKKKPHREATPLLGEIAWRMEKLKSIITGQKPLLTKESAKVAQTETIFDNTKLLKTLPDFKYKPLEATIKDACKKYMAQMSKI